MPKGRKEWAAEMYIYEEELSGDHSPLLAQTQTHTLIPLKSFRERETGSLKHRSSSRATGTEYQTAFTDLDLCFCVFLSLFGTADQLSVILNPYSSRGSLPPAPRSHIWATVDHGDQPGHAPCPSAAFGDGGVPPVTSHSLRLQGRTTRAPPPLRTVWHHRGGGGGLLHPGGGPGPAILLADRGELEEEHQMSSC